MSAFSKPAQSTSIFSYINLAHAVAGGCGSAFAMTIFYPLDIARTRLQLEESSKSKNTFVIMKEVHEEEGVLGLYRGLLPVIESLYCSNFVYFYTFHALKRFLNTEKSAVKDLFLGLIAGWVNVLMTTPLWVVNTRMKMQGAKLTTKTDTTRRYKGLFHGVFRIWRDEGVHKLWSGALSSLILAVNPAIQFMTYEALKRRIETFSDGRPMGVGKAFLAGAIAKAIATVITYPLQLIQTRQRHGHKYPGLSEKAGIISILLYIVRLQGPRGLFKGLEAKILQTVSTAALMFVFYEKIASFVFLLLLRSKNSGRR